MSIPRFAARTLSTVAVVGAACVFTAGARAQCVGDCDANGEVAISELISGVNVALGTALLSTCESFDADDSGSVEIDELVAGVGHAIDEDCASAGTPTPTATPTTTPTVTPTLGADQCGNRIPEPEAGETCDDGNTSDGDRDVNDNCPFNCMVRTCAGSESRLDVIVRFAKPEGPELATINIFVRYPDGVVALPPTGSAQLADRIIVPSLAAVTPSNNRYALRALMLETDFGIPADELFTAQFDFCSGAAPPTAADFRCTVVNAFGLDASDLSSVTTCSVELP